MEGKSPWKSNTCSIFRPAPPTGIDCESCRRSGYQPAVYPANESQLSHGLIGFPTSPIEQSSPHPLNNELRWFKLSTCASPTRAFRFHMSFLEGVAEAALPARIEQHILIVRVLRARRAPGHSLLILLRPRVVRAQRANRLSPYSFIHGPPNTWAGASDS